MPVQFGPGGADPGAEEQNPLRDLLATLKRRALMITLLTLGCALAGLTVCMLSTPLYTASATLEIRGYEPVLAGAPTENLYGLDTRKLDYIKTTIAKLTRLGIADRVLSEDGLMEKLKNYFNSGDSFSITGEIRNLMVAYGLLDSPKKDEFDMESHYVHPIGFLAKYLGLIDVAPVRDTSLVTLSATTSSPSLSQAIANAHARIFIDDLRRERQDILGANQRLLEKQADELKSRLAAAEQDLARYAEKNQLVAVSNSEDANVTVKQIVNLTQLLADATAKRVRSESLLREVESKDPKTTPSILDDDAQRDARIALQQAETEYGSMIHKVTPEYPAMVDLRSRIQTLKGILMNNYQRTLQGLRMQYQTDKASESKLIDQINTEKANAHEMSKRLIQYNMLLKESESLRQLYETVLRQVQETQITGASASSNIFVSDYAARPMEASSPHTNMIVIITGLLGLTIGCLIAIFMESFSNSIRSPEEASLSLGLPFLGSVPSFELDEGIAKAVPGRKRIGSGSPNDARVPVLYESAGKASRPVSIASPQADVSEALRTIRAGIVLSSADHPPKALMVTSVVKGEGKTTVAANLAASLAEAGHKTLLVDVDFRQGRIGRLFNVPSGSLGLVDYLIGQVGIDAVMVKTPIQNLSVVPRGSLPPNPAELVGSRKMEGLMRSLREEFEYLILDSPPVLPVADALMLSRITDATLLVVRSDLTDRAQAQEARNRLLRVRARILGVILNDVKATSSAYSYANYAHDSESEDAISIADVA